MKTNLLKKTLALIAIICLFGINSFANGKLIDRTKATAEALAIVGEKTIIYTLTHGHFRNAGGGELIENWTVGGQDGQDLGAITSISIQDLTIATITVTNAIENYSSYTLQPNSSAMEIFFYAPDEVSVTFIERATATAKAIESFIHIEYTLTNGEFIDSQEIELTTNWNIGGQDGQDLGSIHSITVNGNSALIEIKHPMETQSHYTIQPSKNIIKDTHAQPNPVDITVQPIAKAQANAFEDYMTIEYTLTAGLFSSMGQRGGGLYCENPSNWVIGGQEGQNLGAITSIVVSDDKKSAEITVSDYIESNSHYTIKPLDAAIASPHAAPATVTITVSKATSLKNSKTSKISVFPNPSTGIFNINAPNFDVVEVFNITGSLIYTQSLKNSSNQVNMQNQHKGVYLFVIKNNAETETLRVVVE